MLRPAWILWGLLGAALAGHSAAPAAGPSNLNAIERLEYASMLAGRVAVRLGLSKPLAQPPAGFRILHPGPRIVLEFPGTTVATAQKTIQVDSGALRSVHLVQQGTHTRLVLHLLRPVGYETQLEGNSLTILLDRGRGGAAAPRIREVAFRRGANREGRVIVQLSMPGSAIGIREQGRQLVVDFPGTGIEPGSLRRLEYAAYQSGTEFVIAFTPRPPYPLSGL